jgi:hypothetical protein
MPAARLRSWSVKVIDERSGSFGYDAQADEYGDMFEKCLRLAPKNRGGHQELRTLPLDNHTSLVGKDGDRQ